MSAPCRTTSGSTRSPAALDRTVRRARRAEPGAATVDVGRLGSGSPPQRC